MLKLGTVVAEANWLGERRQLEKDPGVNGIDILLSRLVAPATLAEALAAALGVSCDEVLVVGSLQAVSGPTPVVALVIPAEGDEFPLQVALYLDARHRIGMAELRSVSKALDVSVLVPDESPDPYVMILIEGGEPEQRVDLDAESLDGHEEHRVRARR